MKCRFVFVFAVALSILASLSISFVSFVSATIPDDCPSGMVSLWKFDGSWLNNFSGPDVDEQGATVGGGGKVGNAMNMPEPSSSFATILDNQIFHTSSGSVEFWFSAALFSPTADTIILDKLNDYKIYVDTSNNLHALVDGSLDLTSVSAMITGDKWHFVVLTWDGSDSWLYLDGDEIDSKSGSVSVGSEDIYIGTFEGLGYNYAGLFDELAIYNRALTPTEITEHYTLGTRGLNYCWTSSGYSSDTRRDFTLAGCDVPGSSVKLAVTTCSRDGHYYCDAAAELYDTLSYPMACTWTLLGEGDRACCPSGYICEARSVADGGLGGSESYCYLRLQACEDYDNEDDCEENSCYWIDDRCIDPNDPGLSCSIYLTKPSCEEDIWNFGKTGAGTEVCGTTTSDGKVIPFDSCRCVWLTDDDDVCVFNYTAVDEIWDPDSSPDLFNCLRSTFSGPCIGGEREINWTVKTQPPGVSLSKMEAAGCTNGTKTQICGQPIVALPFFGVWGVVGVCAILVVFYFFMREEF
jgi:hypothetical protein